MNLLIGAMTIGLIMALLSLGVFITYRVFDRIDLTAEGSYGLGAAVSGVLLIRGTEPLLATACGAAAGAGAGIVTGLLRVWLGVPRLLAGIVTSTGLYSVILYLMHGGDLSLASKPTLVTVADQIGGALTGGNGDLVLFGTQTSARNWMGLLLTFVVVAGVATMLNLFFQTNLGLSIRATGNNRVMARAQGVNVDQSLVLALAISNGLIGLSGAIFAQFIGFVNISLGAGIIVTGLASLMIGEVLFGKRGVRRSIVAAAGGAVVFRLMIAGALRMGLDPNSLKLVTAIFVVAAMVVPRALRNLAHHPMPWTGALSEAALELHGVRRTFAAGTSNEVRALQGVDLTMNRGEFAVVLGTNGSGKSSLLNAIAGSFPLDRGIIRLDGLDLTELPEHRRARMIGRVFQDPFTGTAADLTIAENLALAARRGRHLSLRSALSELRLDQLRQQLASLDMGLEDRLDAPMGRLSGGQRQAITLLMATLVRPSLLLLDEHTAALDPKSAELVLQRTQELIRREGLTTLMVTHSLQQAVRIGDRVLIMHRGQIVQDISGVRKRRLRVDDLLDRFEENRSADLMDAPAAAMVLRNYV